MLDRFERDVLSVPEATHVVILGGVNDIAAGSPADQIVDALFALARRAADHGIQPMLGTITPFMSTAFDALRTDTNEKTRHAVNLAVRSQPYWPAVDFAAHIYETGDPTRLATVFDSGDGLHPNDAGALALAEAIPLGALTGSPNARRSRERRPPDEVAAPVPDGRPVRTPRRR